MEEGEDEFGDLYADVGVSVNGNAPASLPFSTFEDIYDDDNGGEAYASRPCGAKDPVADEMVLYGDNNIKHNNNNNGSINGTENMEEKAKDDSSDGKASEHTQTSPLNCRADKLDLNEAPEDRGGASPRESNLQPKEISRDFFESEEVLFGRAKESHDSPAAGSIPMPGQLTDIPGLSGFEEVAEQNGENWGRAPAPGGGENWGNGSGSGSGSDSDSDDDLRIVLNDDRHRVFANAGPGGGEEVEEGSDNEDEDDDLVIVTGGEQPIQDGEWGEESQLPLEGAVLAAGGPADERHARKGSLGILNAAAPGHSYHSYHPHFKYVRPGATAVSGIVPSSAGATPNQNRSLVSGGGVGGPGRTGSMVGRGEWSSSGGRANMQRSSHSGASIPHWSSGPMSRVPNGFEFTLPSNKTIFDINIDSFEEKPWRHPGVDITDFFNFDLDETSWKQYSRQLEQFRLEATMQSKIHVYESGRSEQEYDPDLPPELAAAAGICEASGESMQHKQLDIGSSAATNLGRGIARGRAQIPTGRAIQVEGGFGERLPSVDIRRPRLRDSDAVIQIVLQDVTEHDTPAPEKAAESVDDINQREESEKKVNEIHVDQRRLETGHSMRELQTAGSWEREATRRKPGSGGGNCYRSLHDGDGILPLPPGPPIMCKMSNAESGICPTGLLGLPPVNRRSVGEEQSNESIANQEAREIISDSYQKEKGTNDIDRKQPSEIRCILMDGMEKVQDPETRSMSDAKRHSIDEVHFDRSDDNGRSTSELKIPVDEDGKDNSALSIKRQKLSPQKELPASGADHDHVLNVSKSDNSKAESRNGRDYSQDQGNGEQEMSIYKQQKRLRSLAEIKIPQFEEETHLQQRKEYHSINRHDEVKDVTPPKGREVLYHRRSKEEAYLHRDREEVYHRKVKEESLDKHRERGDHTRFWQGRDGDIQIQRDRDDDMRRRERLVKEDGLKHRNRRQDAERHEREEHLHMRKRKDDDDRRDRLLKEEGTTWREVEGHIIGRQENEDDLYFRKRKEEELRTREKADMDEGIQDMRGRDDIGRDRHNRADLHFRKKEEESRRRDRFDDNRPRKHRDDSWRRRGREDEHWRKPGYEEMYGRREREEERSVLASRSRHRSDDKMWHGNGRDENHPREDARVISIDRDNLNEKRRREEPRAKVRDRLDDEGRSRHHEQDVGSRKDRLVYEERSARHERTHVRYDISGSGHSGEEQRVYREKHKLDAIKSKDFEDNDRNGSTSGVADDKFRHDQAASKGRRKSEDYHQDEKVSKRGIEGQAAGRIWCGYLDCRTQSQTKPPDTSKNMHEDEEANHDAVKLEKSAVNDSFSEIEQLKRDGSNLELQVSHKEKIWDKDASKNKESINCKEVTVKMEERAKMDQAIITETNGKLVDERQREEDHVADQGGKGMVSEEPVPSTDSKKASVDQTRNHHHLETVAKLEKRRERFKQPILGERNVIKKAEYEAALQRDTTEVKQERPARKRRWGSN